MIADLFLSEMDTDLAIINAGCLRANAVFQKGLQTQKMIASILPITEYLVVKKIPGHIFHKILENALSQYPKYEGRWPCISGCLFNFDPEKPAGSRILLDTFFMKNGELFDFEKHYTLTTVHFLSLGKDGFKDFLDPRIQNIEILEKITV